MLHLTYLFHNCPDITWPVLSAKTIYEEGQQTLLNLATSKRPPHRVTEKGGYLQFYFLFVQDKHQYRCYFAIMRGKDWTETGPRQIHLKLHLNLTVFFQLRAGSLCLTAHFHQNIKREQQPCHSLWDIQCIYQKHGSSALVFLVKSLSGAYRRLWYKLPSIYTRSQDAFRL